MTHNLSFVAVLVLSSTFAFAQLPLYYYEYPNVLPSQYKVDAQAEYEQQIQIPHPEMEDDDYGRFAESNVFGKKSLIYNGVVYSGWTEMEDYLNAVMSKILPDSVKNLSSVTLYCTRETDNNAYATHDGTLYMQVSLLADVNTEAGLAMVLGHEISHYIQKDIYHGALRNLEIYNKHNKNKKIKKTLESKEFSRSEEHRADSLGLVMANNAGYNVHNAVNVFLGFMELESITEQKMLAQGDTSSKKTKSKDDVERDSLESVLSQLLNDHPETKDRIDFVNSFYNALPPTKGDADFLVDENKFRSLQKKARLETLYALLKQHMYISCAERAFRYYLLDPENMSYVWYLMESVRRACYLDSDLKKHGFLTQDYPAFFSSKEGILHDLTLVVRDTSLFSQIKATELVNDSIIEFETYEEAYKYFAKIAVNNNVSEAYLSLALNSYKSKGKRDSLLKVYVGYLDGQYRDYAQATIDRKLISKDATKELLLIDNVSFYEEHFYGLHLLQLEGEEMEPKYRAAVEDVLNKEFPDKEVAFINGMINYDFKKSILYRDALYATTFLSGMDLSNNKKKRNTNKKYKQLDLFVLDPDFWYLFHENDLKSLEFMKIVAYDDRTQWVSMLNPIGWYYAFYGLIMKILTGSERYEFNVLYYSYDPTNKSKPIHDYVEEVHYKMTRGHLRNAVYYALKSKGK